MASLGTYIQAIYGHEPAYPSRRPEAGIFGLSRSAPCLDRTRTNRILVYPGSFNPPHRGHLHLLKHVFYHGCHDINVIAAIVLPRSDQSVMGKCKETGGTFMFGRDERCLLWKQDLGFPDWAWVYEDNNFDGFICRLKEAVGNDGYRIEIVMLYGPGIASPSSPPTGAYDCEIMIMSNAAREAHYQRSSGSIKDFTSCTRWKPIHIDKERLKRWAETKALHRLLDIHTICPKEVQEMLDDGPEYVVRTTETNVAAAIEDLGQGNVIYCRRQFDNRQLTVRFVKGESTGFRGVNAISSTEVRAVMQKKHTKYQRVALELMALSTHVLWWYRSSWVEKARVGANSCIKFPPALDVTSDLDFGLGDDFVEDTERDAGRSRKRSCILATRQGASTSIHCPSRHVDDLVLVTKKSEMNQKQPGRRNSW